MRKGIKVRHQRHLLFAIDLQLSLLANAKAHSSSSRLHSHNCSPSTPMWNLTESSSKCHWLSC